MAPNRNNHEAGASCICPDVWQEKERLQEGKKTNHMAVA